MRVFLLILIFSSLSGLGGFYYGRITASDAPVASTPGPDSMRLETTDYSTDSAPQIEIPSSVAVVPNEVAATNAFAQRATQKTQTLTDKQGRKIEAEILSVTDSDLTIRRTDGLETTFAISRLIESDIEFCDFLRATPGSLRAPAIEAAPTAADAIDWDAIFGDS